MNIMKKAVGVGFAFMIGTSAYANCGLEGKVSILTNAFPILDTMRAELYACQDFQFKAVWKQTKDNISETEKAFSVSKSPYDAVIGSNSQLGGLLHKGLLRPLDDLVAKYKDEFNIEENMLIRVDGKIYAVAFQANAQHFMYRKDLFEKYNIAVPKTYDDVLAAAEILKQEKSIDFPFGAAFKSGWNVAQEFNNIFLGFGGQYFMPGTNKPAFNSQAGINALNLMKKIKGYMSPNALTLDSGAVQNKLRGGKLGMAFLWGTRAAGMDDAKTSKMVGKIGFSAAPAAVANGNAATTTWWDGVMLPANSAGNDDLAFKAMMTILSEKMVKKYNDNATWLRSAYKPAKYAVGVAESFMAGAPSQPMNPAYNTVIHGIMGKQAGEFLSGQKSAKQALADAEEEYLKTAKEKGFL